MNAQRPTALLAEDEPLLAAAVQLELAQQWPDLQVVAQVGDGPTAVQQALALRPDVLFLDIRMPGMSGLQVAEAVAEDWPDGVPLPATVFVTAYDQYAVAAFEAQAVDYLLKPVQADRLARTVARLQSHLSNRAATATTVNDGAEDPLLARLRALLAPTVQANPTTPPAQEPLRLLPVAVGQGLRMVPVDEVLVFEAADKYVRVLTASQEWLLRTPLKDLLPQLDAGVFWQVHRGTVVRAGAITQVNRDEAGKQHLQLQGLPGRWPVSRLYAHRFKAL